MMTYLIKDVIPCACDNRVEFPWGTDKTTAYPMFIWRKKGLRFYYKCFKCGAIKELSLKDAITDKYEYLSVNSNGEIVWKCPTHGYHVYDLPNTKAPDETMDSIIEMAERGFKQPCCIVEQKRNEREQQDYGEKLCIHCDKPNELEPLIKIPCVENVPCDLYICSSCLDHTQPESLAYKLCIEECPNAMAKKCDCNTKKYFVITSVGKTGTLPMYTCRCTRGGVEVDFVPNGEWLDYFNAM